MRPDDIGDIAGEPRIPRRGDPLGQSLAAIIAGLEVRLLTPEELRLHVGLGQEVLRLPVLIIVDDDFLRVVGILPANLREEGVETIIVTHRPAIERVVMALSALDAHPHEHLGDVFAQFKLI